MCGPKQKIDESHERFQSLEKNAKNQTDIDGFKSDLYFLWYGPLEPMVINFTCDFSLLCIPPR